MVANREIKFTPRDKVERLYFYVKNTFNFHIQRVFHYFVYLFNILIR